MTIFKNLVHKNVCRTAQFWPQPKTLSLGTVGDVMASSISQVRWDMFDIPVMGGPGRSGPVWDQNGPETSLVF